MLLGILCCIVFGVIILYFSIAALHYNIKQNQLLQQKKPSKPSICNFSFRELPSEIKEACEIIIVKQCDKSRKINLDGIAIVLWNSNPYYIDPKDEARGTMYLVHKDGVIIRASYNCGYYFKNLDCLSKKEIIKNHNILRFNKHVLGVNYNDVQTKELSAEIEETAIQWLEHTQIRLRKEPHNWWKIYRKYLNSPEWEDLRNLCYKKFNGVCRHCGSKIPEEEACAHHIHYRPMIEETQLEDIILLCRNCHRKEHENNNTEKYYDDD